MNEIIRNVARKMSTTELEHVARVLGAEFKANFARLNDRDVQGRGEMAFVAQEELNARKAGLTAGVPAGW
jgi:hypothetical protein